MNEADRTVSPTARAFAELKAVFDGQKTVIHRHVQRALSPEELRTDRVLAVMSSVATVANHAGEQLVQIEKDVVSNAVVIAELHEAGIAGQVATDASDLKDLLDAVQKHVLQHLESVVVLASGRLTALTMAAFADPDEADSSPDGEPVPDITRAHSAPVNWS